MSKIKNKFSSIKNKLFKSKSLSLSKVKINPVAKIAVLSSLLTSLIIVGSASYLIWNYKAEIFNHLAQSYLSKNNENNILGSKESNITNLINPIINSSANQNSFSMVDLVKKVNPAVVSIEIMQNVPKYETSYNNQGQNPFGDFFGNNFFNFSFPTQKQIGTELKKIGGGSGFIVSSDGLIVTNKHVVNISNAVFNVYTTDGKKHEAKVLAKDPVLDIALIKISGSSYSYLELGDSDTLELGQAVVAIGNALAEFDNTISTGIISGLSRSITAGDGMGSTESLDHVIQTDAAINPGNSGGPLLNLQGKVIGVNVAVAQGSENIAFALPINSIKSAIQSVKETGKITRPYIGVRYVSVTSEMKTKNNLSVDYGILVSKGAGVNELAVMPGSPADKAGLVENDIILEINGQKITSGQNFSAIIRQEKIGDIVNLKVLSKGIEKNVSVKLEAMP